MNYRCKHCGQTVFRIDSTKAWFRSYCYRADRTVHLVRVS